MNTSQTGVPAIAQPTTSLKKIPIPIPPKKEVEEINKTLSSIQGKIDLLRRQNDTLEQIAQTLFKRWFVEFEFPFDLTQDKAQAWPFESTQGELFDFSQGSPFESAQDRLNEMGKPYKSSDGKIVSSELGEIPEGWRVASIKEFGDVVCGKTPSKAKSEYYNGDIHFIKIPDMHGKIFVIDTDDKLSETGSNSQLNKYLPRHSINVSCIATVGLVTINSKPAHTNQQINSVIPFQQFYREYLYFSLNQMAGFLVILGSGGTATLNVNTSTFSNLEILFPAEQIIKEYSKITKPIFDKIEHNYYEIQTLTRLRDMLLPKLMSGKIRLEL